MAHKGSPKDQEKRRRKLDRKQKNVRTGRSTQNPVHDANTPSNNPVIGSFGR